MVTSFIDYMGWVSLSFNLKESFDKAQKTAIELGHHQLDIPHLLFTLIDNPEAAISLSAHHIDRQLLRHQLTHHALSFSNKGLLLKDTAKACGQTLEPSKRIQRLMAQASQKADMTGKTEIDGADVINALIDLEQQISAQYSQENSLKLDHDKSRHYKYQEDLFAYDKNNRLLNWGFSPQPAGQSPLYLSHCLETPKLLAPLSSQDGSVEEQPEDSNTGSEKIMKYSYPDQNTVEYNQIQSSLESLMDRRADAEDVLQDCEWYQLLKNLEQVSDELDETAERHQKKLAKKARLEINKVDRWRKAYQYITHLDSELTKFQALEKKSLQAKKEDHAPRDIVIVEREDRELSRAIEERMHMLEKHVNQLEKKLKYTKKPKKQSMPTAPFTETSFVSQRSPVADFYLENLKDKIQSLEEQLEHKDYHLLSLQKKADQYTHVVPAVERENDNLQHEIDYLKKENASLNSQLVSLRKKAHHYSETMPHVEREKESLQHEVDYLKKENDGLNDQIVSLREKANKYNEVLPGVEKEKASLKQEADLLKTNNDKLNERVAELEKHLVRQDSQLMSLRDKANRRKQRLTSLTSHHESLIPELKQEKATLRHEVSLLQGENDELVHKIAELETRHNTLEQEFSGSSSEVNALKDAHDRLFEKNNKRKQYITSLEEQIKGLESNNQRQDKLILQLHSEIEGYKKDLNEKVAGLQSNNERQDTLILQLHGEIENYKREIAYYKSSEDEKKQTIERLMREIREHKDSTHLLAQEKLTLDQRLKLAANEAENVQVLQQKLQTYEQKLQEHDGFSQNREQRIKALQNEVQSNQELLQSINEKLTLQKEKATSRERHVRTLEQHVKAQENEISILKKQMATQTTQAAAPIYAAPGRRSTVMWRDNDSLVEIVRASF